MLMYKENYSFDTDGFMFPIISFRLNHESKHAFTTLSRLVQDNCVNSNQKRNPPMEHFRFETAKTDLILQL